MSDTKPTPAPAIPPGGAGKPERAIARCAETVSAVVPKVDAELARAAIVRVTSRTESRNMITEYLVAHPTALVDGDSGAPDPVARLIGELIAVGVDGLERPCCFDCGEPRPLLQRVPGGRVCNRCKSRRRPLETCASCGTLARRAKRDADGQPICGRCNQLTYVSPVHRCGVCGVNRTYRTQKRICRDCAELPHTNCAACGLPAAIPTDGTEPCCSHCVTGTTQTCRECGELTAGRDRKGQARCERCYQRPVGTCGRCGRVRAIARLAVDDDPDLCAICWTGPTTRCENCGKVRPCRGERRGRMLCGTCTPVRPQTCAHCARQRRPTAHWPEGPVCRSCYDRALDAKGSCPQCGEQRRLMRYDGSETAICRECAGVPAHHVCGRCGDEHAPYQHGLCASCVTKDRLSELLGDQDARRARGLDGLFELLLSVRSIKDRPRWLSKSPIVPLLAELGRGELVLTHDALDQHPSRWAARRLEHLLVAAGALPSRDPTLARMEAWIAGHLAAAEHEPVLTPFAQWIVLRRYRRHSQHSPLNEGHFNRAKAELLSATAFLDWLTAHDRALGACTQADIEAWVAGPRADRLIARGFARWAMSQKLMPRLDFSTGSRGGPTAPIASRDRAELVRGLLENDQISARDRVAAILVAVYAQPIGRVARVRLDDISIADTETTIRFGRTPVVLPPALANALRVWLEERHAGMPPIAEHPPWLFPGNPPSRTIGELSLSRQLKRIGVDCNNDRRAALLHLASELPAAIVADVVGVNIRTAAVWAGIAGRPWGDYPSLRDGAEPAR